MAEVIRLKGNKNQVSRWLRDNYPGCLVRDEDGNETGDVQSYYDHDVAISYIKNVVLDEGEFDENGNEVEAPVFGGPAIMVYHITGEPAEQQKERKKKRKEKLDKDEDPDVRDFNDPAVEEILVGTIGWSDDEDKEEVKKLKARRKKKKKKVTKKAAVRSARRER